MLLRMLRRALLHLCALLCVACPSVKEPIDTIAARDDRVRIAFTAHTYPLTIGDLQYYLADRIRRVDADFAVLGGDVVTGVHAEHLQHPIEDPLVVEEQWDKFDLFRKRLGVETFLVLGNHDLATPGTATLAMKRVGGERPYYARRIGDLLLVFLNTVDTTGPRTVYQLDAAQVDWLADLLDAAAPSTTVLLFLHHQLWNLDAIAERQPVGDRRQFEREVKPRLDRFAQGRLFAGDDGVDTALRRDGNIHYHAFSNTRHHIGFLLIDVDRATGRVVVARHLE